MQHIGVDIIEIGRIETVTKRWGQTFLARVFTPAELKLYSNTASLAARFAAKEAVLKHSVPATRASAGRISKSWPKTAANP